MSDDEPRRFVRFLCTDEGRHGRVKLGDWTLTAQGIAYELPSERSCVPLIDSIRQAVRPAALDVICRKCPNGAWSVAWSMSASPMMDSGYRHYRLTAEHTAALVRARLDEEPDLHHPLFDLSRARVC